MAAVFVDGRRAGEVLSAAYGHRVDAAIAIAMLNAEAAAPGTQVEIEVYGQRLKATVQETTCLWDADNSHIRA